MAPRLFLVLLWAWFSFAPVHAQAWQCRTPAYVPRPALELPTSGEIRRSPVKGYTLALSWSPEQCRGRKHDPSMRYQCSGKIGEFGFVLHGLWPETNGPRYPQYCRTVGVLSREVVRSNMCVTPTPQLQQHEWAKHGTCMAKTPEAYFGAARLLFHAIQFPDMVRLSRQSERGTPLTAATIAEAFAELNEGLPVDAMRVKANKNGWLEEVRICLGLDFKPRKCRRQAKDTANSATVKVWRGTVKAAR
jgi:ribonuclease T2